MEFLRAGSLNINGGRDGSKLAMVSELFRIKKMDIVFCKRHILIQKMSRNGIDGGKESVC